MSVREQLVELSGIDKQINGLRTRLDGATARLNAQQSKLDQIRQQQAEIEDQHKRIKSATHNLETEVAGLDEKIETHRAQMNSVTSNKEYSALLVEINTLKDKKNTLEENVLQHMQAIDQLDAKLADIKARAEDQQKLVDLAQQEVEESKAAVQDRLDTLNEERKKVAADIPDDALKVYGRALDVHDGDAMAMVTCQNKRRNEFTCESCFMTLPVECVNTLMSSPDELVSCPSCQCILYVNPAFKESMAK